MVDTGYPAPAGKIVVRGEPPIRINKNIGVATEMYPGRLTVRELTDYDIKVGDGILPPIGFLEFERSPLSTRPANIDSIYTVDTEAAVIKGGGYAIRGKLAKGFVALEGDDLFSWGKGMVAPGCFIKGMPAIKVPFTKKTSVEDTNVDIPAHVLIHDVAVYVAVNDASGTIDVGFENATESGDLDGLLDGESCASVGWTEHNLVDATDANNTLGALLYEVAIKDATGTPVYYRVPKMPGYETDGTIKSLVYTTSNHTISGDLYLMVSSPGIVKVGKAGAGVSAIAADADIIIEAVI
jgi:hypothetical protein